MDARIKAEIDDKERDDNPKAVDEVSYNDNGELIAFYWDRSSAWDRSHKFANWLVRGVGELLIRHLIQPRKYDDIFELRDFYLDDFLHSDRVAAASFLAWMFARETKCEAAIEALSEFGDAIFGIIGNLPESVNRHSEDDVRIGELLLRGILQSVYGW